MKRRVSLLCLSIFLGSSVIPAASQSGGSFSSVPTYTEDGKLLFPAKYREWIYLSSAWT